MNKIESSDYTIFSTAFGKCAVAWRGGVITALLLPENSASDLMQKCSHFSSSNSLADFHGRKKPEKSMPASITKAILQIQKYFAGEEFNFKRIKIDLTGVSPFYQRVYSELQKIETGCTISYKGLAQRCESPGASRAVGSAVASNPIPLLIPCHRVINADGHLGGFSAGGGLELKARMLRHEGVELTTTGPVRLQRPPLLSDIDLDSAIEHLAKVDLKLGRFIKAAPRFNVKCDSFISPFQALLETIIYQQLNGKAASTIFSRVLGLFSGNNVVLPLDIIRATDEELRSAGLSGAKIAAARDLADFAISGRLPDLKTLQRMPDREIIATLTQIRGIGRWTVEMLLIFKLGRADVMAIDDYGLRKGLAVIRGTPQTLPSPSELANQGLIWKPFRSIASWYLWRASETAKS